MKGKLSTSEKALANVINEELEKKKGFDEVELERMRKDSFQILSKWIRVRLPQILEPHESERALSYHSPDFEHLNITGKIDLIEELGNGNVRVTDFKTGTVKKKSELEKNTSEGRLSDYRRQLTMYSYLLENATRGSIHVVSSCLEFLEAKESDKDAIYSTEISSDDVSRLHKDISDFDEYIRTGTWVNRPCDFKPYKGGRECEYCKLAKMYDKKD